MKLKINDIFKQSTCDRCNSDDDLHWHTEEEKNYCIDCARKEIDDINEEMAFERCERSRLDKERL